jgi:FkbM family methyltransferase
MGSYLDSIFTNNILKNEIKTIFEIGSRDLIDADKLQRFYNAPVYAFECNPDCLIECEKNKNLLNNDNIHLIRKAISNIKGTIDFFPFDLQKYNNMGSSSALLIDFTMREKHDPDYNRNNCQSCIKVETISIDDFCKDNTIIPDMLCIDVQGYELNVLNSCINTLDKIKYIILETSIQSTYVNGATFSQISDFLKTKGFEYKSSNMFNYHFPDMNKRGFSEFDSLFINKNIIS